jgi:branched-chain amino acid transport system ATP-binding protein
MIFSTPNRSITLSHVSFKYEDEMVLKDVSLEVKPLDFLGIIGPNGAGKTTLFSTISGFHKPERGAIYFKGKRIDGLKPHVICKTGLVRTFQIAQPFPGFTPYETLLTAALNHLPMNQARDKAREVLEMVGLANKAGFVRILPVSIIRRQLSASTLPDF